MISHGIEISIAKGGREKVCEPKLMPIFVFIYIYIFYIMYSCLMYKNSHAALAIA